MPMIKTSTKNDAVKFIYHECTHDEENEILRELLQNEPLREEIEQLKALKEKISNVVIEAPQRVVDKIMSLAKQNDMESA